MSSAMSKQEYEVFLCFEGSDKAQEFNNSLYDALNEAGVAVFRISKDTQIPTAEQALQDSKICVVVLSPGFAWSELCLRQVARMVKLDKDIVPIFYGVPRFDESNSYDQEYRYHSFLSSSEAENWGEAFMKIAKMEGLEKGDDRISSDKFCEDVTEHILGIIRRDDSSFHTVREFHRDLPKDHTKMTITSEYENNEGQTITLLSSTRGDGTADFRKKITAIPLQQAQELCMEDNKMFSSLHKNIITPDRRSSKRKTAYFHGHYISVEDWCKKLYDIIGKLHNSEDHGTISAWWWKHAEDFIKSIARDVGSGMKKVHQAGHYHGNIADGIFIGVEPSKLNDTADTTYMGDGGFVYRNNTCNIIERVNIKTDLKAGYIGNFRRRDETGVSEIEIRNHQAADVAAFYKVLVYMITYGDKGTDGFKTFDQLKGLGNEELIKYGKERLEDLARQLVEPAKKSAEEAKYLAEEKIQLAEGHKMAAEAKKKSAEDKKENAETAKRSAKCRQESREAKQESREAKNELWEAKKELAEAKKELAEAEEQLAEAKEQLAAAPEILRDLNSFLSCLGQVRTYSTDQCFPMGWIFCHPYLFDATTAINFVERLHFFMYEELDKKVLGYVQKEYNPDNLKDWRDRAKNSTIVNHSYYYKHPRPKQGEPETIPKNYKTTISCIKAFRHALQHHSNKLRNPEGRDKAELVKKILQDFNILPDIFESMKLLTDILSKNGGPGDKLLTALLEATKSHE